MSLILWIQHSLTWTKPTPMIFALNSGNHHKAHKPSSLTWARESDKLRHRPWIKTQKSKNITNHKRWKSSTQIYWTKSTKKTTFSFSHVPSTSLSTTFSQLFRHLHLLRSPGRPLHTSNDARSLENLENRWDLRIAGCLKKVQRFHEVVKNLLIYQGISWLSW